MSDEMKSDVVRWTLDSENDDPAMDIVKHIAEMRSKEPNELTPMWECIDGILDHIFSNPPAPEAQIEVSFSYEGYRITVDQEGVAKFVET